MFFVCLFDCVHVCLCVCACVHECLHVPMHFIGVTHRNISEGLLAGAEMMQGQLYHPTLVAAHGSMEHTA